MGRGPLIATTLLAAGALIAGCGSQTKTVTVSSSPPHASRTSHTTTSRSSTKSSSPTTSTSATGSVTETTTRTSSAPAFVGKEESEAGGQALHAAVAVVRGAGYTPNDAAEYHPEQTLRVLIGTKTGSADGHDQRAFFFLGGKYIGTDAAKPSASVNVASQGNTEVTLAYGLYRSGDPLCCPSGGTAKVRFQLNNGKLVAVDQIPPAHSAGGLARL